MFGGNPMSAQSKVLVIDDEDAARYGISRALSDQNYELEEAADGMEALEKEVPAGRHCLRHQHAGNGRAGVAAEGQ